MIIFVRIDDRVIHGQTMVRWLADYPCDGIIIVDDSLAENTVMAQIYKNAVSSNIKVHIFNVNTAINKIPEAEISLKKYMVIFKSILTLSELTEKGCVFVKEINVGPSSKRPNTREIVPTISLDIDEINAYKKIASAGIKAFFQIVPSAKKVWWSDVEKTNNF